MKKIDVKYNTDGYIEEVSDNSIHFEQENGSLQIDAQITTDKKVRAYIKSPNNNSTVTDELTSVDGVYSCVVDGDYMAKGTLYVGYELYDDNGYVERLEPLKVYIDSFVNLGGGSSDNVYVVTIKVGNVKTLANGEPATVENAGTKKDMILNFGLPRGEQGIKGDKGDKGDTGPQGERGYPFTYSDFTEEELEGLKGPKGDKGDTGPKGEKGEQGIQGIQGIQGVPGKDGYTPVKGVDYFTVEDIKSLGIDDKVDKVNGKGLSTNDFTNYLKSKVENNTFTDVIELVDDNEIFYQKLTEMHIPYGISIAHTISGFEWYNDYALVIKNCIEDNENLIVIKANGEIHTNYFDYESGEWQGWTTPYASQTDLNTAIGDIETSLENIITKYGLGGDDV